MLTSPVFVHGSMLLMAVAGHARHGNISAGILYLATIAVDICCGHLFRPPFFLVSYDEVTLTWMRIVVSRF